MATSTFAKQLTEISTQLMIYYLTPIYIFGILGNSINIIVFLRHTLRSNACSQYFVGMSIAQIILFNTFGLTRVITSRIGYDLAATITILCKIRICIYILSLGLMRQFLCLISIDRWIISTKHAHIRKLSSPRVVRWLIIGSTCFWILFSIHGLIGYEASPTRGCASPLGSFYAYFYTIQVLISSFIPFFIITMFSILTLRNIRSYGRIQAAGPNPGTSITVTAPFSLSLNRRRREIQLIKVFLLQTIFYVLLSMITTSVPFYVFLTSTQTKTSDQSAIDAFIINIGIILLYTFTAITFPLYTLVSETFRKEFLLTFIQLFKWVKRFLSVTN